MMKSCCSSSNNNNLMLKMKNRFGGCVGFGRCWTSNNKSGGIIIPSCSYNNNNNIITRRLLYYSSCSISSSYSISRYNNNNNQLVLISKKWNITSSSRATTRTISSMSSSLSLLLFHDDHYFTYNSYNYNRSCSSSSTTTTANDNNRHYRYYTSSSILNSSSSFSNYNNDSNKVNNEEGIKENSTSFYTDEQKVIMKECQVIQEKLYEMNTLWNGPLLDNSSSNNNTILPFVLILGNHSSGKSSFINYLLNRNVQHTGVAPTDDCFTIIAPGPIDSEQDGLAAIGDPDLGFTSLQQFGPVLQQYTILKIRNNITTNFIIVDTPGMMDAPANATSNTNNSNDNAVLDRGYDFTGVIRWYANRADIVCLFFDPDKPGTTGETLRIFLQALYGMDHKLLIILNKADQFNTIHDFARAYGSLCWNLSKVIPRKDLPRIYTMCLPQTKQEKQEQQQQDSITKSNNSMSEALKDLDETREQVIKQVRRAPERRMDNIITSIYDIVKQLQMHAIIIQDIKTRWSKLYWNYKFIQLSTFTTGSIISSILFKYSNTATAATATATAATAIPTNIPIELVGGSMSLTIIVTSLLIWYQKRQLIHYEEYVTSVEELNATFQRTHSKQIYEYNDESIAATWQQIKQPLYNTLQNLNSISELHTITKNDVNILNNIIQYDIPKLRRQVAPKHYGKE